VAEPVGRRELAIAGRAACWALVAALLATISAGLTSRTGLALTFVLWLVAILAGLQAAVAAAIGLWRRAHA
jgi:hypothetical protein